jgi:hypothetical protein
LSPLPKRKIDGARPAESLTFNRKAKNPQKISISPYSNKIKILLTTLHHVKLLMKIHVLLKG